MSRRSALVWESLATVFIRNMSRNWLLMKWKEGYWFDFHVQSRVYPPHTQSPSFLEQSTLLPVGCFRFSFLQVPIAFVRRVELTPPSSLQSPKQNASNQTKQPSKTQTAPAATLFHSKPSPTHQPKFAAASSHTPSCEPNGSPPFPPKPFVPSLSRPAPVIQSPAISPVQSPKQAPLSSPLARHYFVPIKKEKEPPSATLSPPSPKKNTRYMDITQRTKIPEWARSKQLKTELRKQYWLERYFVDKVMLMNCRME